jgi:integrase
MSIKIRKFRTGGYEVDIHTWSAEGLPIRERVKSPADSKEATSRWAQKRAAHLALDHGPGGCRCKAKSSEEGNENKRLWSTEKYLLAWCEQRKAEEVSMADKEFQRFKDHVIPFIGKIRILDVRPKHAHQLVKHLARKESVQGGLLAPRTVRNIFFEVRQAFQDAVLEEIIPGNPMILRRGTLPRVADKDPTWRPLAVFTAAEVEQLISDPKVSPHRRVAYAIEFLTGLRTGQVSALRWGDYEPEMEPLGRIVSSLSWNSHTKKLKGTKTGVTHEVPVHPTLAKVLGAWKLAGWSKWMGRAPNSDDLIIPNINNSCRDVRKALEDFHEDLVRLKLRKRRHYDSRRTFITLGLSGGASKDVLKKITHPRPADAFDLYVSIPWDVRCEAVSKLRIDLKEGTVISMPRLVANGGTGDVAETVVAARTNSD